MKAAEALKRATAADRKALRQNAALARRQEKADEQAAKEHYPSALKEATATVKSAVARGYKSCVYETSIGKVANRLVAHFKREGYSADSRFVRETSNMGDFSAPGNAIRSAAERPAPTCATCRWWDGRDCPDAEQRGLCNVDTTDYLVLGAFKTRSNFGCTLHEPAPPGPVAQEKAQAWQYCPSCHHNTHAPSRCQTFDCDCSWGVGPPRS